MDVNQILYEQLKLLWSSVLQLLKIFGTFADVASNLGMAGILITFGIGFVLVFLVAKLVISNVKLLILILIFYVLFSTIISILLTT